MILWAVVTSVNVTTLRAMRRSGQKMHWSGYSLVVIDGLLVVLYLALTIIYVLQMKG